MPATVPLSEEHRRLLAGLARQKSHLSASQVAALFRARTGREIGKSAARLARLGKYDQVNDRNHLTDRHRALLDELIRESAPDYNWTDVAAAFSALAGRAIRRVNVRRRALRLGIDPGRSGGGQPGGDRRAARVVERNKEAASGEKLAKAPCRPGYHARTYRGPDGGPAGDSARVYRAVTGNREGA